MRYPALILSAALVFASCSVKESRRNCPCRLEIDYSSFAEVTRRVWMDLDGQTMERPAGEDGDMTSVLNVPKRQTINIQVWSGVSRMKPLAGTLSVPEGEESDSLFLFGTSVPGTDEFVRVSAVPHKQFASVLLRVLTRDDAPVTYTVVSDYSGIGLDDGRAVRGSLRIPLKGRDANHTFRLPRQAPDCSLVLEAGYGSGVVHVYPLGEWIRTAGYDWDATDLADIAVGADFALGVIDVRIGDWDPGQSWEHLL